MLPQLTGLTGFTDKAISQNVRLLGCVYKTCKNCDNCCCSTRLVAPKRKPWKVATYARTTFKSRCCLNFQSMRTQAESTDITHNIFRQIRILIPVEQCSAYAHSKKWGGKPRMKSGQFLVVR
jgi:hypothetical protein